MDSIIAFFKQYSQAEITNYFSLPESGSSRKNYVIETKDKKFVVTYNENIIENEAFFYYTEVFSQYGVNCPKILLISKDKKTYIQDFLGEKTLFNVIHEEGLSENVKEKVKQTLFQLFELQKNTQGKIDFSKGFEYEQYDELPIIHDLYYFKNFFIDVLEIHYHKSTLLKEFKELSNRIENLSPKGVMIRDFQSRNIMVNENGELGFIDYQSAMKGPLIYDVVSFLFQAKANFPASFQNEMLSLYYQLWNDKDIENQLKFSLEYIKLIRFMQVLGAYGFRGLIQRKSHFLESIGLGIINLTSFVEEFSEMKDFPELYKVIKELRATYVQDRIKEIIEKP